MKTKVFLLIGLYLFSLGVGENLANNPKTINTFQKTDNVPHGYEIIELQGSLMLNTGPNVIDIGVSDVAIFISFNQNIGNVTVTLYGPNGSTIYCDVSDTSVQQFIVIPATFHNEDVYTIVFENYFGYASGEFEIGN